MIRYDCTSAPQKATQLTLNKGRYSHSSLNLIPKNVAIAHKARKAPVGSSVPLRCRMPMASMNR